VNKDQKRKKPAPKKPVKQPKDLSLKAKMDKTDLVKVVGAGGSFWTG